MEHRQKATRTPLTPAMAATLTALETAWPDVMPGTAHGCPPHTISGRSATALVRHDLARYAVALDGTTTGYVLSPDGALHILAGLGEWPGPVDAGDPFVIETCAKAARQRGYAKTTPGGLTDEDVDNRVDHLLNIVANLTQ